MSEKEEKKESAKKVNSIFGICAKDVNIQHTNVWFLLD